MYFPIFSHIFPMFVSFVIARCRKYCDVRVRHTKAKPLFIIATCKSAPTMRCCNMFRHFLHKKGELGKPHPNRGPFFQNEKVLRPHHVFRLVGTRALKTASFQSPLKEQVLSPVHPVLCDSLTSSSHNCISLFASRFRTSSV